MQLPFTRFEKSALVSVGLHFVLLGAVPGPTSDLPRDETKPERVLRIARVVRPETPPPPALPPRPTEPRRIAPSAAPRRSPAAKPRDRQKPRQGRRKPVRVAVRSREDAPAPAPAKRSEQQRSRVEDDPVPARPGGDAAPTNATVPAPRSSSPVRRDDAVTLPEPGPLAVPKTGTTSRLAPAPVGPLGGGAAPDLGSRSPGAAAGSPTGSGLGRPGAGRGPGGHGPGRGTAPGALVTKSPTGQGPGGTGGGGHGSLAPIGSNEGYTGVIIDCRGLGLQRAQSPRLCVSNKASVRWGQDVSFKQLQSVGIAKYYRSVSSAMANIAGPRPLVIRAKGVTGPGPWYPMVTPGDISRMIRADRAWDALSDCKVAFLQ